MIFPSPDNGESQTYGLGAFPIIEQVFRQGVYVLGVKVQIDIPEQKPANRICHIQLQRRTRGCPPETGAQDETVFLPYLYLQFEVTAVSSEIGIFASVFGEVSPDLGSNRHAVAELGVIKNEHRLGVKKLALRDSKPPRPFDSCLSPVWRNSPCIQAGRFFRLGEIKKSSGL